MVGGSDSTPPSDLDHVVGVKHLQFKRHSGAPVTVRGWPEKKTEADKKRWIDEFSDHGLLYFEVLR